MAYFRLSLFLAATALCASLSAFAADPEGESLRLNKTETVTHKHMAVAAHPLASGAGDEMLRQGGNAADAAVAMQLVLGLVEPQSSGIGGGGFLTYYDAKTRKLTIYDGRESAPAADKPDLFLGPDGQPLGFREIGIGGRPVGVPGVMRMLEMLHKDHGKLPWAKLFEPAIKLAEQGFPVTPRLNWWLTTAKDFLSSSPSLRAQFYNADGSPMQVGEPYKNAAYGKTLRALAAGGADAFYSGDIARQIVAAVSAGAATDKPSPGAMTLDDLKAYRAVKREAVCGHYRQYEICGAGPPSGGTIAVIQTLGMLEPFDLAKMGPGSAQAMHLFAEASRRAFADRDAYVGDPATIDVPVKGMLDPVYLKTRSATIDPARVMSIKVLPGEPPGRHADAGGDATVERAGTSNLAIVDADGNGITFTTTVNGPFGAHLMAGGFILNNQLLDFSTRPMVDGRPVANAVASNKRPRSSMSPLIVFDANHKMRLLIGSPGGSKIVDYVALATIAHLDWNIPIQKAVDFGHVVNTGARTELEDGTNIAAFADALRAMGHQVELTSQTSGLHAIAVLPDGYHGGADYRREGVAVGE